MRRELGLLALALSAASTAVSQAAPTELPDRWRVQGDGRSGILEMEVGETGSVSGSLLEGPVTGFLSGRKLVMRRTLDDRTEVWEGWLPADPAAKLFVAGTVTVSDAGGSRVHPWFAVPAPADVESPPVAVEIPPAASPVLQAPGGWDLTGVWVTTGGRAEVTQHEKLLTVVMPDGSTHSGRFTAGDTVVLGLGRGCCKGKLEGPDLIRWSDDTFWRRAE